MADTKTDHELWSRINNHTDKIGEMQSQYSHLDAKMESVETKMDEGFRRLSNDIKFLLERTNRPTNWTGLTSAVVGVATAMVGFVYLVVAPLNQTNRDQMAMLASQAAAISTLQMQSARSDGVHETELKYQREWVGYSR